MKFNLVRELIFKHKESQRDAEKFQSNQILTRLLIVVIFFFTTSTFVFGQSSDTLAIKHEIVFEKVDIKASIQQAVWRHHLESHLQEVLDSAAALGIPNGKHVVKLRFIVEKDGSITNVEIIEDPGYGLGKGAEQILLTSPKWTPGKKKGKKVRSYFIQPIGFVIEGDEKL